MVNFFERELKKERVSQGHGCYLLRLGMGFIFNNFDSIKAGKTSHTKTKKFVQEMAGPELEITKKRYYLVLAISN